MQVAIALFQCKDSELSGSPSLNTLIKSAEVYVALLYSTGLVEYSCQGQAICHTESIKTESFLESNFGNKRKGRKKTTSKRLAYEKERKRQSPTALTLIQTSFFDTFRGLCLTQDRCIRILSFNCQMFSFSSTLGTCRVQLQRLLVASTKAGTSTSGCFSHLVPESGCYQLAEQYHSAPELLNCPVFS